MNITRYKNKISLSMMFSAIVFLIQFVSVLFTILIVLVASNLGYIDLSFERSPQLRPIFIGMAITSVILGFVIALITLRYPLKPFNNIIEQMNRLANGDFKARLEINKSVGTHPAVIDVCDSFNKMAAELEGTEMLRSDFINNFSHEFKTPIVSIAGFAKLLKRGNLTEEQKAEYIDIIEEESLRLAAMANNVLDLTRVENQSILSNISHFNVSEQIRSVVLLLENKWEKKNVEILLEFDEHYISAEEDLLKQVWINLLDNAIKFSPEYGFVEIKITKDNEILAVSITNSGSVISPENQKKIWNKFLSRQMNLHSSEGNGIGLAIVRKIVELHKGKVSVRSLDDATTFTVQLPCRNSPAEME